MTEIFKYFQKAYLPLLRMRYLCCPYTIINTRDLDSQLPRTVYSVLETIAYKRQQLWQELPAKIKK